MCTCIQIQIYVYVYQFLKKDLGVAEEDVLGLEVAVDDVHLWYIIKGGGIVLRLIEDWGIMCIHFV